MLVLVSNLVCGDNVAVTSKTFTQLIVSPFQIKLPNLCSKHKNSSLVINLEVGEDMVTSLGVTSKSARPCFPLHQGN